MKNQNLKIKSYFNYLILINLSFLFFLSCGSDKIVLTPYLTNTSYERSNVKRDSLKIIKVYDRRFGMDSNSVKVGTAKVGMLNKEVPYSLSYPVSLFVEKSINRMIMKDTSTKKFVPVSVIIDTFTVYEKTNLLNESGYFKASLNFTYPVSQDSIGIVSTYTIQEAISGSNVTDKIESQIYLGIRHCTEQFIENYDKSKRFSVASDSIPKKFIEEKTIPKEIKEKTYNKVVAEKKQENSLAFTYYTGDKIRSGYGFNYINFFIKKESQFVNGLGYGFTYLDIKDRKDIINARMTAFRAKYIPRYFLSQSKAGLYLSGGVSLTFGSEKIGESSNFFIGPTLEENLGVKFGPVFLEGGFYQLIHFGSKILPDDTGFIVGFGFQF